MKVVIVGGHCGEEGEVYEMSFPGIVVRGILFGTLVMELVGKVWIKCERTGYLADWEFKPKVQCHRPVLKRNAHTNTHTCCSLGFVFLFPTAIYSCSIVVVVVIGDVPWQIQHHRSKDSQAGSPLCSLSQRPNRHRGCPVHYSWFLGCCNDNH